MASISTTRIEEGDDIFQLPWDGWEEDISEIRLPSLTVEDELDAQLKIENVGGSHDVTSTLGFDICDDFPGVSVIDVQSLFNASEEIDLQDLFDNIDVLDPETSSPLLHSLEEDGKPIFLMEPSIQSLTDYGNDFMLDTVVQGLWNADGEEVVCATSVDNSDQCETPPDESDSCEGLLASPSGSSRYRSTYAESSAEEEEEDSVDDEDWTMTRKRRRNGRKVSTDEPRRKLRRSDPKTRKKEQNRNAATRYREKKKVIDQEMQTSIEMLEIRNKELKKEIQDKEHEVHVMRQLLVDILRPK
jgi:hypothetical protein